MTGSQNSNVVQFISMLKKDNKREQMVYYQVTTDPETPHTSLTDAHIRPALVPIPPATPQGSSMP